MTDFSKPQVTDAYATLLPGIQVALSDLARALDPGVTSSHTNTPIGAVRWVNASSYWERFDGSSWSPLAGGTFAINITGTAAKIAGGAAGNIPYQSAVGVTGFSAAGTAGQPLLSGGTAAPTFGTLGIAAGGTGATSQGAALTALGAAPISNPAFTGAIKEAKSAMGANDISLASANFFTKTISTTTTLTVSNVPSTGTAVSLILELTNGGAFAVTWWAGVKWSGGTAPMLTASGVDVLGFYTHDGGTTWRGLVLARDSK